ncbi:MAG: GGDEF domain-containing protein [Proteobacteria bacterium]|nr:GGDEF domain-containing protein [Pseudomonadota bacterium]
MKKITSVLSTACLEVTSTATGQYGNNRFSGFTNVSFGGEGYHVATLLSALDTSACLISAINHKPISQLMVDDLAGNKVRSHLLVDDGLPDAVSNYHYKGGKLSSVVVTNPNSMAIFSEDFISRSLNKSHSFFMDLNSSIMSCENIKLAINAQGEDFKLFISAFSSIDSDKLNMFKDKACLIIFSEDTLKQAKLTYGCDSLTGLVKLLDTRIIVMLNDGNILICESKDSKVTNLKEHIQASFRHKISRDKNLFKACIIDAINNSKEEIDLLSLSEEIVKNYDELLWRIDVQIEKQNPLENSMRTIIRKAHLDNLTGVLNRHGLDQFLTTPGIDLTAYTMLIIDADFFKKVNDTYGHQAGDEVLMGIADVLKGHMRQGDISARFGGEEFICLIKNLSLEIAEKVANRIRIEIEKTKFSAESIQVTVSIGCTHWQQNEMFADVMDRADKVLYKAKDEGRNRVLVG